MAVKPLMTAVFLMTSWWLGPQLAAAMASDKTGWIMCSQSCLCSKFGCPGEVTVGGPRPSQSCCPSPSGASAVAGTALGKHTALVKAVESSHLSVVPSRLVVTRLQPLASPLAEQRAGQMLWTADPRVSLGGKWAGGFQAWLYFALPLGILFNLFISRHSRLSLLASWEVRMGEGIPPVSGHPHAALCQPRAARRELCWEPGGPWAGTGVKTEKGDEQGKFRRSLLNSCFTC